MAHQQHQLSMLQRLLPSAKKVPGWVKGRVSMTLQDGASTSDILTGILQARNPCLLSCELAMYAQHCSCNFAESELHVCSCKHLYIWADSSLVQTLSEAWQMKEKTCSWTSLQSQIALHQYCGGETKGWCDFSAVF